ncbi:putative inactive leucine-rich repeat receptor-like protein kinase [Gossypium australe]|uniref:Putative inactive leucine-rich repeat receptor-like protein kinase n=1 Tax=Gossypium australe TaxID=47621 RepID=A0A5B6VN51_9ROSI|nr:putative inactive leucine-rich repeat receptor-like protein kinase [Gossypium australe]
MYPKSITVGQPRAVTTSYQGPSSQESNSRMNLGKLQFTPIPMTYRKLYQNLFEAHVVSPFYSEPMQPLFPKWYDANPMRGINHSGFGRDAQRDGGAIVKGPEGMLGNLNINAVSEEGAGEENFSGIFPCIPENDFEDDRECSLSPDLLRTVKQDEKKIIPYKESVESMAFLYVGHGYEAEWIQPRYDQLNLIEEKRLKDIRHGQMYQKRMMRAYDKKVRPREFHEGDLRSTDFDRDGWQKPA